MKGADVEEEWEYVGEWAVEEPKIFKGMEGDKGLVVKNAAAHHAISAKFPKAIDNKGKTLVVQYEVKLQSMFYVTSKRYRIFTKFLPYRWSRVWWRLPEAPQREQGPPPGGVY